MAKMIYEERNLKAIAQLGDKTKVMAMDWYNYCKANKIEILITETIRSVATQKQNVAKGASQTMRSYHIVGQAIDFVPVKSNGAIDYSAYEKQPYIKALQYAKKIGFGWGGDWKTFKDKPHLENKTIAYGSDTFKTRGSLPNVSRPSQEVSKPTAASSSLIKKGDRGQAVKEVQGHLVRHGYKVSTDGIFGAGTEQGVKSFQKDNGLIADGIVGAKTLEELKASAVKIGQVTSDVWSHSKPDTKASTRVKILAKGSKWKVYGEENGMYKIGNEYVSKSYIKLV
ncbi:peptidoglycan-binding protein [Priestia megaterium]